MKKTLHIDERLLRNAKSACGAKTDTDTVRLGLEALVATARTSGCARRGSEHAHARLPGDVSGLQHSITQLHDRLWLTRLSGFGSCPIERHTPVKLDGLLSRDEVSGHDFVFGELLIGDKGGRRQMLADYERMHQAPVVPHADVVEFVRDRRLHGRGVGWIDAHLLASPLLDTLSCGQRTAVGDVGHRVGNWLRLIPPASMARVSADGMAVRLFLSSGGERTVDAADSARLTDRSSGQTIVPDLNRTETVLTFDPRRHWRRGLKDGVRIDYIPGSGQAKT